MEWGIITAVIIYEIATIGGVGWWLARRRKGQDSFLLSGRDFPAPIVGITLALSALGSVHILGLFEMAWFIGAIAVWFSLAHVVMLAVVTLATGRWARKLHVSTVPEMLELIFGKKVKLLVCCVMAPVIWGIMTLETQGMGILAATMTGWTIKEGALLGVIIGVLYVIVAGMKEIGYLNIINAIVKYAGVIIAIIWLTSMLPFGWEGVGKYYTDQGQDWMISIGGNADLFFTFAVGSVLSVVFCQGISQMLLQTALSARDDKEVKKSFLWAAPINGMFGVFTVLMGLAAKSLADYYVLGPKLAAPMMLLKLLPGWLMALLLAAFLGSVLSTFAMTALAPATIFVKDIYVGLFKPNASDAEQTKLARAVIIVLAAIALSIAVYLPPIVAAISWLFAWMVPVFWLVISGLFWKRNGNVAMVTMLVTWVLNCLWSFTDLPQALNLVHISNTYVTLASTFVVGGVLTAVCSGEPGYFRSEEYAIKQTAEQKA